MNIFSIDWLKMTSDAYWYQYPGNIRLPRWTRKGWFSFQSQRREMPKNVRTTAQWHSSHTSKVILKILQSRLQQYVNWELPDVQAGFRKGRGTRDQIANSRWIIEKAREFQKNIYFCFIDNAKAFDSMYHNKLWKILQEMGIPPYLTPEKSVCRSRSNRTRHETTDWFKILRKEYVKVVYCHTAYLTYMQSISCEMPNWMKHTLKSRLLGEISITSDMQMIPPLWQKVKRS